MPFVWLVTFLTCLALVATLRAATLTPGENPVATPAPAGSPRSLKDPVPVEPLGDSVVARRNGFEVVPGKDPNGWSFTLEPYGWAMGMAGDIGVKGLPPTHVDFSAKTLLQHLDWGKFAKGEIRKGRWGILADGLFAELSALGDPPGPLYNSVNVTIQQGLASLALAYRIIDDRRGFVDIYAGARYNYFGLDIGADVDESGIREVGNSAAERIVSEVSARVQSAVDAEVQRLRVQLDRSHHRPSGTSQLYAMALSRCAGRCGRI